MRAWLLAVLAYFVLGGLVVGPLAAQPDRLRFTLLDSDVGLEQKRVMRILQDRRGFLWIGTTDGLARYDGLEVELFQQDFGPGSLANNDIRALLEDNDGSLWVATYGGGLDHFDPVSRVFTHHRHDPDDPRSLGFNEVFTLAFFGERLWIGTYGGGLDVHLPGSGEFTHYRHDPDQPTSLANDLVEQLLVDRQGRLWVATGDGLDRFDPAIEGFVHYRHDPEDPESLIDPQVRSLALAADGSLWVGTMGGAQRLDPDTGRFETLSATVDERVHALHEDSLGRLWIGTQGNGLLRIDPATGTTLRARYRISSLGSLSDNNIMAFFEDRSGLIWLGTAVGVNFFNPRTEAFVNYRPEPLEANSLNGPRVRAVFQSRDGIVWAGTMDGLNAIDRDSGEIRHWEPVEDDPSSLADPHISAILEDHAGRLWIGSPYSGISLFDRRLERFRHYRHDPDDPTSLPADDILVLHEDSKKRLWVGTYGGGLALFDREHGTFKTWRHDPGDPASLANDHVFALWEGPDGTLWLGTWWGGLNRFDPERGVFTSYRFERNDPKTPKSLSNDRVQAIYGDAQGILWRGTRGGGLNRFDPKTETFTFYGMAEGMPSRSVFGVLPDDEGNLWLSTSAGIACFDPRTEKVRVFDASDGIQGNVFSLHSAFRGADGEIFFGGNDGLTIFRPSQVRGNPYPPRVALVDVEIPGRGDSPSAALAALSGIHLEPDDPALVLAFAALDFSAPRKNRYAYRLDRVGDDTADGPWTELGTNPRLTFNRLDPGAYNLRVRGSNDHDVWSVDPLLLRLNVDAPWWERTTTRMLGAVLLMTMLVAIVRVRARRTRERTAVLEREIAERRRIQEEREHWIAELENKNTELERFTYTVSHDLKSPLFTIQGFLGLLERDVATGDAERIASDVLRIRGAAGRMQQLLDDLLELSRLGHQLHPDENVDLGKLTHEVIELLSGRISSRKVRIEIEENLPVVRGDRVRLFQVLQNLIDNAIKFLGDTPDPRIEIGARGGVIHVRDNGAGIAPSYHEKIFGLFDRLDHAAEGTGIGLTLVRRIVELHGGRIWVESEGDGRGSTFYFTLEESVRVPRVEAINP